MPQNLNYVCYSVFYHHKSVFTKEFQNLFFFVLWKTLPIVDGNIQAMLPQQILLHPQELVDVKPLCFPFRTRIWTNRISFWPLEFVEWQSAKVNRNPLTIKFYSKRKFNWVYYWVASVLTGALTWHHRFNTYFYPGIPGFRFHLWRIPETTCLSYVPGSSAR